MHRRPDGSTIGTLVDRGTFGPVIIVMPDGDTGWWVNSKDGSRPYESFLLEELIPYIDDNYRTIAERDHIVVS